MWGKTPLPATGRIDSISWQSAILTEEKGYRLPGLKLLNKPFAMTDRAHHFRRTLTILPLIPPLRSAPLDIAFTGSLDNFLSLACRTYLLVFLTHGCLLLTSISQGNLYVRIAILPHRRLWQKKPRPAAKQTSRADFTITNHGRICVVPHIFS
jgi:hypothetical protein